MRKIDLEHALTGLVRRAEDQGDEVGRERERCRLGAAIENIAPVRSIRVDGPGAWRISKFSTNRADTMCMVAILTGSTRSCDTVELHVYSANTNLTRRLWRPLFSTLVILIGRRLAGVRRGACRRTPGGRGPRCRSIAEQAVGRRRRGDRHAAHQPGHGLGVTGVDVHACERRAPARSPRSRAPRVRAPVRCRPPADRSPCGPCRRR